MNLFSEEETEALDVLEAVFGPVDPLLHNVTSRDDLDEYGYPRWIKRNLTDALVFWGQYKHALGLDWEEIERVKREKEEAKLALWRAKNLDGIMTGVLAGLMPKLGKAGLMVGFDVDSDAVSFTADDVMDNGGLKVVVAMTFDKRDKTLLTEVDGHRVIPLEDVSLLSGNRAPREQLAGLRAVLEWLEAREAAREAAGASDVRY